MNNRVVLAYSGGLKASAAIPSLIETHRAQVVAVALDLGQGDDMAEVRHRALSAGAVRCHVIDARDEFARDFVVPSLKADALLDGRYPMATALGRPLIGRTLVTIARIEDATTVAHAGTGADHHRMSGAVHELDPALKVVACAESWHFSQSDLASIAGRHEVSGEGNSRVDRNLWGRTVGRWAEADARDLPDDVFVLTRSPEAGANHDAQIEIEFANGVPTALNGVAMPPVELVESLTTIGAEHGIGRLHRIKSRQGSRIAHVFYEAPAAVLLHAAHQELQRSLSPGSVLHFAPSVAAAYVDLIDRGEWFSNLRPALDAFVNQIQQSVTGVIRLKLFKGGVTASGMSQPVAAKS